MHLFITHFLAWAKTNTALISSLSLVVAILGFLLTHFTRFRSGARQIRGWLGSTEARYKTRFLKLYRELRNIYLDRVEVLNIESTYVPLHIISPSEGPKLNTAIDVLLNPARPRLLIIGDPGSGKTTLLKAFGVSLCASLGRKSREAKALDLASYVPIYVELRDFAARREKYPRLYDYIASYVLFQQIGMLNATLFLRRLLSQDRCIILLDALDEVSREDYDEVRSAIHDFLSSYANFPLSRDSELAKRGARVVMTSRLQNFLPMLDDWIPTAFLSYHVLAPFSDEDIIRFLQNRSAELPPDKTVSALWEDIKNSSTLDLHRTPLILTVSLGLYIHSPRYAIPDSIALFYQEVTRSLLQRHDFRTRPHLTKRNLVPFENKAQFLRSFAFAMALRPNKFDEFTHEEIQSCFESFRDRLTKLSNKEKEFFLSEIIDNAGLLRHVGDNTYVFAHRSFHEYFIAEHLTRNADLGIETSLKRSQDPLWRQVIVFFSAMDHDRHDNLLNTLSEQNPELAGHCLSVSSRVSIEVATGVIDKLSSIINPNNAVSVLSALSAICRSSNEIVREKALSVIGVILADVLAPEQSQALWGLGKDDVVRLVKDLAATDTRKVIDTCIRLSLLLGQNDDRLVSPLWRCLEVLTEEPTSSEARRLVSRLLELTQTEEGFRALELNRPLNTEFIAPELRDSVYPFHSNNNPPENLITLLAWADLNDAVPEKKNGYLTALSRRQNATEEWHRIEKELSKKTLTINVRPFGFFLFWGGYGLCAIYLAKTFLTQGFQATISQQPPIFHDPWEGYLALWAIGITLTLVACIAQTWLANTGFSLAIAEPERILSLSTAPFGSTKRKSLGSYPAPPNPTVYKLDQRFKWLNDGGVPFWDWDCPAPILACGMAQIPLIEFGLIISKGLNIAFQISLSSALALLIFWLPTTRMFLPGSRLALRRRGTLATLISGDKSSETWIQENTHN